MFQVSIPFRRKKASDKDKKDDDDDDDSDTEPMDIDDDDSENPASSSGSSNSDDDIDGDGGDALHHRGGAGVSDIARGTIVQVRGGGDQDIRVEDRR